MYIDSDWIRIGGINIQHPVTAGTNALLAIQCLAYFFRLRASTEARARLWSGFFIIMALATFAGAFKHGVPHLLGEAGFAAVLAVSNLGSGVSTYFAQRATITCCEPASIRARYRLLIGIQLAAFLIANVIIGPRLFLLIINSAVGLLPVIANEALHSRSVPGAKLVAIGLSISILTGVVYIAGVSAGSWFNHIDLAHVIMAVSFLIVFLGARQVGYPKARTMSERVMT